MKIGNITVGRNGVPALGLAPMAGVTDLTFRGICRKHGADFTVTEMVSAKALRYSDRKTPELCRLAPDEHPSAIQLFGREPLTMAWAAAELLSADNPPDFIDINMGCPMPKITKNGEGAALMREPELAAEIVAAVVRAASPAPVTVKIRSGWDEAHKNAAELARMLEQAGAAAITVHGRTREQLYSPPVDLDTIVEVVRAVSIPVIGNGGIMCAADTLQMLAYTGCHGVAIARGAQGRPWIFEEIRAVLEGRTFAEPSICERIEAAAAHMRAACADKGMRGVLESRGAVSHYIKGIPGAAQARDAINRATSPEEIEQVLARLSGEAKSAETCFGD
jgi:tRNA-dihydrouridine synthase B